MKIKLTPSRIGRLRPKKSEYTAWDAITPHFGVRVMTTGAMRFIHLAPVEGRLKRTTIGDAGRMPLDEARAKARDIDAGCGESNAEPCPTLREWIKETWIPQTSHHRKPGTRDRYRRILDVHLLPAFGQMRLDAIGVTQFLDWFERYSRKSPIGANRAMEILNTALNHAVRAEVIPFNPLNGIRPNPSRKMTRFLDDGERERLLATLDALPPSQRPKVLPIKLLLFTGCRHHEILSLRWEEVGEKVLNLAESKTGARKVWLSAGARAVLDEAKAMQEASGHSKFVFPRKKDKGRCMGDIGYYWRKIRVRAGIPDVRLHDLRHSFASEAVRQGIPLLVVSKLLGHSKISMTMRYVHASSCEVETAADRIAEHLFNLLQGPKL